MKTVCTVLDTSCPPSLNRACVLLLMCSAESSTRKKAFGLLSSRSASHSQTTMQFGQLLLTPLTLPAAQLSFPTACSYLRKMVEWLSRLSRAARRSGHFLLSSTRKKRFLQSFFSSESLSFSSCEWEKGKRRQLVCPLSNIVSLRS